MSKIFVISAPSGAGKRSIRERLLKLVPELSYSVSMTTRKPREEDAEGVTYYFVTREQFESAIAVDGFIEYSFHLGNYYGTPRAPIERALAEGRDVLLEIETIGAKRVFELYPDAVGIFIMSDRLEQQLIGRNTEHASEIAERLEKSKAEISESGMYKYTVLNKFGSLDDAVAECEKIIKKEQTQHA